MYLCEEKNDCHLVVCNNFLLISLREFATVSVICVYLKAVLIFVKTVSFTCLLSNNLFVLLSIVDNIVFSRNQKTLLQSLLWVGCFSKLSINRFLIFCHCHIFVFIFILFDNLRNRMIYFYICHEVVADSLKISQKNY